MKTWEYVVVILLFMAIVTTVFVFFHHRKVHGCEENLPPCPNGHTCAVSPDCKVTVLPADPEPKVYFGKPELYPKDGSLVGVSSANGMVCSLSLKHEPILGKSHTWKECATLLMETEAERWGAK